MAKILIADEPEGVAFLQRLLAAEHELTVASTMKEAVERLRQTGFDLIIVGVHFDDSRMFELMAQHKNIPENADKPIISFCTRDTPLTRTMHESIDVAAKALGAWMYLDQHDYNVKRNPDAEVRRVIERCLLSGARKKTQEKRADILKRRKEILRLRQALEAEQWSTDLADRVADLRENLSEVLLELSKVYINNVAQQEKLAESKDLEDRVSPQVRLAETEMAREERDLTLEECKQLAEEQQIVQKEEAKAKKWRRKKTDTESQ